jgi:hypothetical protein
LLVTVGKPGPSRYIQCPNGPSTGIEGVADVLCVQTWRTT